MIQIPCIGLVNYNRVYIVYGPVNYQRVRQLFAAAPGSTAAYGPARGAQGGLTRWGGNEELEGGHDVGERGGGGYEERCDDGRWLARPSPVDSFKIATTILSVFCLVEGVLWCLFRPIIGVPVVVFSLVPASVGALVYAQVAHTHTQTNTHTHTHTHTSTHTHKPGALVYAQVVDVE